MTNQISASQQRQRIPTEWQIVFQEWTNDSLLSLSKDGIAPPSIRAYAGWELDYRVAFGILIEDPPEPPFVRPDYEAKLEAHRQKGREAMKGQGG